MSRGCTPHTLMLFKQDIYIEKLTGTLDITQIVRTNTMPYT